MKYLYAIFGMLLLLSCGSRERVHTPKPRGFFKIDFPQKTYQKYNDNAPFSFEYPSYAKVVQDSSKGASKYWKNVVFPQFKGRIHLSYQSIDNPKEFKELLEDAHSFAFKHTIRAESIDEAVISDKERNVYGVYYIIEGNPASWLQFYLTDSTHHYLRGALYFWDKPRIDSIKPVLDFVRSDVNRLIKTLKWKK